MQLTLTNWLNLGAMYVLQKVGNEPTNNFLCRFKILLKHSFYLGLQNVGS